jgi:hypothetical protein
VLTPPHDLCHTWKKPVYGDQQGSGGVGTQGRDALGEKELSPY